jgi:hypothetical protein
MHSGKLWTPEGFGFTPDCQSWWSLLVRQARLFREMAERERQVDIAMQTTLNGPQGMTPAGTVGGKRSATAGTVAASSVIQPKRGKKRGLTPPSSNTGGKVLGKSGQKGGFPQ